MSGFTIPDMHNDGIPILARKSFQLVASRWRFIQLVDFRCNHDKKIHPHGMIRSNYKGKWISQMVQEWFVLICRKVCTGIEKAFQAKGKRKRLHVPKGISIFPCSFLNIQILRIMWRSQLSGLCPRYTQIRQLTHVLEDSATTCLACRRHKKQKPRTHPSRRWMQICLETHYAKEKGSQGWNHCPTSRNRGER